MLLRFKKNVKSKRHRPEFQGLLFQKNNNNRISFIHLCVCVGEDFLFLSAKKPMCVLVFAQRGSSDLISVVLNIFQ